MNLDRRLSPSETQALVAARAAYEDTLRKQSVLLDGEWLRPSAEGVRVGKTVVPGPFAGATTKCVPKTSHPRSPW